MAAVQDFFDPVTPPYPGYDAAHPLSDPNVAEWERTYAVFQHLTLLAQHVLFPVIPALIMWLIKRDRSPFIDDHGKEAVNFQISLVLYYIIGGILSSVCIGIPMLIATYVLGIVGMIMAAVAAGKGRYFRYPACIRLLH